MLSANKKNKKEVDKTSFLCYNNYRNKREVNKMYSFNVYEDYPSGCFRFLCTYHCFNAKSREEAKQIALEWAKNKYPDITVSVMSTN